MNPAQNQFSLNRAASRKQFPISNQDEVVRVVGAFALLGVSKIRLTGGEPLLRRDITGLAKRLGRLPGIEDLSLSTNATRLALHARELREAGIERLNRAASRKQFPISS